MVGKGISYGAARSEASSVHGLDVHIVGAGNSAGQAALFFSTHARSVTLLCRGAGLERSMSRYLADQVAAQANVAVRTASEVAAVRGEARLEEITVRHVQTGDVEWLSSRRPVRLHRRRCRDLLASAEIALDRRGYVQTGPDVPVEARAAIGRDPYLLETSVPGIFACGDVRYSPVKRVAAAVGEGSMAIAFVHQFLRDEATVSSGT